MGRSPKAFQILSLTTGNFERTLGTDTSPARLKFVVGICKTVWFRQRPRWQVRKEERVSSRFGKKSPCRGACDVGERNNFVLSGAFRIAWEEEVWGLQAASQPGKDKRATERSPLIKDGIVKGGLLESRKVRGGPTERMGTQRSRMRLKGT